MKQIPGYITYFSVTSPEGETTLQVALYYYVHEGRKYQLQYTSDGVTWIDGYSFTAVAGQRNHSAGVNPVPGALWPRLLEVASS